MKYVCTFDPDYGWEIEVDDPSYDGPVSRVGDPWGTYHVEANTPEEAIMLADQELAIDDDGGIVVDDYDY